MVESNTSTSVSEEVGLGKTAVTYGDFSSYADQILPETISKSNIARYVPVDKFNTGTPVVFNNRNFILLIHYYAKTSHVLLFKEIFITIN
ncbi:MAG: hypothetical protein K2I46_03865 [Clostridia bacterium]|nr:hypothetical protein [Clostridia bacterium]